MQLANVLVAINGDRDNQVPRYEVTPAEVLVLQALHGNDAVTDIEITEATVERTSRSERERLFNIYNRATPRGRVSPELDALFPGVAARLPSAFADLEIDDSLLAREPIRKPDPLDHDKDGRKGGSRKGTRQKKAEAKADDDEEAAEEDAKDGDNLFN